MFVLCVLTLGCADDSEPDVSPVDASVMDASATDQMIAADAESPPPLDATTLPDGMSGPVDLPTAEDVPANATAIATGALDRWTLLRDGRIFSQAESQATLHAHGEEVWTGPIEGDLIDAVLVNDTILVLTNAGIFALTDLGLEVSPLDALLSDPVRAAEGRGDQSWFADSRGLSHWSEGSLRRLSTPGVTVPWDRAQVAPGQFRGTPSLWLAFDQALIAIGAGQTANAWRFELGQDVRRIAATDAGLFVLFDNSLAQLNDDETWTYWVRPDSASLIAGHPDAPDLWISNGVGLWQLNDDGLRTRVDAPVHSALRVNAAGAAFLKDADTVYQVLAGRFVSFSGLEPGARLGGPTTVTFEVTTPEQVESFSVQLDDTEPSILMGPPWSVELAPDQVGPGRHALSVLIRYADGGELTGSVDFLGPPTWEADIEPLNSAHCTACHGDGGSAHVMNDLDAWRLEIAEIVDDVETGRMPYGSPMLPADQIELIRAWRDTGLLER